MTGRSLKGAKPQRSDENGGPATGLRNWNPAFDHRYDPATPAPRQVKAGMNVTQMHYAKQGLITPEMEFIAIRENMKLQEMLADPRYAKLLRQHAGVRFDAHGCASVSEKTAWTQEVVQCKGQLPRSPGTVW